MKKKHVFSLLVVALLAITGTSCDKRHSAKQLVEDFVDEYSQLSSVSISDVGKLDSTDRVDGGLYKPDTKFGQRPTNTKTLLMLRVTLEAKDERGEKKPYQRTFYLDPELTSVVAVKTN